MNSDENSKRWIDCGNPLEHPCISGGGKLESAVPLRDSEREKTGFCEFSDDFLADFFVFVESCRIDDSRPLHAVDFGNQSFDSRRFFRTPKLEARRIREKKLVVYHAGKEAARERRLELTHCVFGMSDLSGDPSSVFELRCEKLRIGCRLFARV